MVIAAPAPSCLWYMSGPLMSTVLLSHLQDHLAGFGLFTGNGHALPEGIIPHFITGLGGSCREGKEAAPFWNSAPFSSEQRCLSLSAWASASFSTILMNLNLALSAKHERRPSPLLRVTLFCCATAQDSLTDASQKSRPHSVPWTAGNLPYTRA